MAGKAVAVRWRGRRKVRQSALRAGDTLDWDGREWRVLNAGLNAVTLRAEDGSIVEIPMDTFHECIRQNRIKETRSGPQNRAPQIHQRILVASEGDLARDPRRFHIVSRALRGETCETVSLRTLRRWITAYRIAQDDACRVALEDRGCGFTSSLSYSMPSTTKVGVARAP